MIYYKFNNSKSSKYPFFVYCKVDERGKVTSADGSNWLFVNEHIIITKDEFEKVELSSKLNSNPDIGDEIVVIEYVSIKKRYSKVKSKYIFDKGRENEHERVILENGEDYAIHWVKKRDFIHKS